jgi:phosphoribosylformimino-5-aminoimidazole carboxamide ribotide isomerase
MELFPAIDLRAGRAVRLRQGDYAFETVYGDDPVAVARGFADAGARWIHVVDLDAARDGGAANLDVIAAICAAVPECRVQTGGGVRDVAAADARLAAGAARVVVGSAAVERPELVHELARAHPGAVAVGLDVRGRDVATHGWTQSSGRDIDDLVREFDGSGAAAFVVTQVAVDGMLSGPDAALYRELLDATAVPVIASGGIGSLDDLRALAALHGVTSGRTVAGAITGKAIYEQRFTVAEGLAACSR